MDKNGLGCRGEKEQLCIIVLWVSVTVCRLLFKEFWTRIGFLLKRCSVRFLQVRSMALQGLLGFRVVHLVADDCL